MREIKTNKLYRIVNRLFVVFIYSKCSTEPFQVYVANPIKVLNKAFQELFKHASANWFTRRAKRKDKEKEEEG